MILPLGRVLSFFPLNRKVFPLNRKGIQGNTFIREGKDYSTIVMGRGMQTLENIYPCCTEDDDGDNTDYCNVLTKIWADISVEEKVFLLSFFSYIDRFLYFTLSLSVCVFSLSQYFSFFLSL